MNNPLPHRLRNRPTRPILLSLIVFAMSTLAVLGAVILWTGHVPTLAQGAENHLSGIPAQGDSSGEDQRTSGTARPQQEYSTQGQSETPPTQTEGAGDGSTTRYICRPNSQFRDGHDNSMYTVEIFAGSGTSPFDFQTTLDEGDGPAVFTLTIDPEVPRKESLSIGTEANCEGNYVETMIQPSYTIDGGESGLSEDTLEYAIDDDNIVEPDGYIDIRLGGTITFGRNNSAKVWILDNDPEEPIQGLALSDVTISPMDEALEVTWTAPTVPTPTYYWMQSKAPYNGRFWTVPFRRIGGSEESFTLSGLTNGREYTVRMIACNNSGCGAWSRELDGTPTSAPPPPPPPPSPSIQISSLVDSIEKDDSDLFRVTASNLNSSSSYKITVSTNNGDIGFDDSCRDQEEEVDVSGSTSHTANFTLYACDEEGGRVTAELVSGTTTLHTDRADVEVTCPDPPPPPPTPSPTPEPTAPGKVGTVTLMRGYRALEASWSAPSDGGSPITGYDIQHKERSATWSTTLFDTVGANTTMFEITVLTNGTLYNVRVRAVNRAVNDEGKGDWSEASAATPSAVPFRISRPTITPHANKLVVDWSAPNNGGSNITTYKIQHKLASRADIAFAGSEQTVSGIVRQAEITSLQSGTAYDVRVTACNSVGCGLWARLRASTTGPLATPTDITIVPLSLRRAKLIWTGDPDAVNDSNIVDDYIVQVRRPGMTSWQPPNLREQSASSAIIVLDVIWEEYSSATPPVLVDSGGLADVTGRAVGYQYRIRAVYDTDATDDSDPYLNSDWSNPVWLIDTPITSINGISEGTDGQALVNWQPIPGAAKYKLRWRKMPAAKDSTEEWKTINFDGPPTYVSRQPGDEWQPTYAESPADFSDYEEIGNQLEFRHTDLVIADIYAYQLVYETSDGTEGFAGRESYVWPWSESARFPNDGAKVATYPYFGHWPSKNYKYDICSETFLSNWDTLIEDAFDQWATATNLVDTTLLDSGCEVDPDVPMTIIKSIYNEANEVFRVDTDDEGMDFMRLGANEMLSVGYGGPGSVIFCIFYSRACMVSLGDTALHRNHGVILGTPRYARLELPGIYYLDPGDPPKKARGIGSVDILVNQERDNTPLDMPTDVRFNTCIGNGDYTNYELMVHEAGHALGLSNRLSWSNDWELYARDHSTIQDSVMNYDDDVIDNQMTDGTIRYEKDCSPHPFDILGIYALYQGVE